jgi:hypothetical protein
LDQQSIAVEKTMTLKTDGKTFNIDVQFLVSDLSLSSGTYRLVIRAYDGTNESRIFRNIYIEETPTYLKGIFYMTKQNNTTKGFFIDSVFSSSLIYNGYDISSTSFSAVNKQIYIAGYVHSPLTAYNVNQKATDWSVNAYANGFPTFTSVDSYDGLCYVSLFEKIIRGYDKYGSVVMQGTTPDPYIPRKILKKGDQLIVEEYYSNSTSHKLARFNASSGISNQEVTFTGEVVRMFNKDERDVIVFINNGGTGQVVYYNSIDNYLYGLQTLSSTKIKDACSVNGQYYLVADGNSIYKLNNSEYLPFLAGENAQVIKYDDINKQLIAGSGTNLKIYDIGTLELKRTIQTADSIAEVQLITNK